MNRAVTLSRKAAFKEPVRQLGQFRIAARSYQTADGPAPRARSGRAKFLLYTTLGAAAFYSGSTVAALNNERYQDFFVESVPLGERIIDYLDTHDVGQEIKSINLGGYGEKAVGATKSAYGSVSGAVSRLLGEGSEVIDENARDARAQLAEARKKAQAQVTKVAERVEEGAKEIKVEGESSIKKVQDKTAALVEKAKKAASEAEARIKGEHPDGRGLIKKAVDSVQVNTDIGKDEVKAAPSVTPYVKALPVGHEAPAGYVAPRTDRKLEPPSDKAARLRPDPEAPKLPLLAPSIKSLSGSEPMIAQLAGTIDELSTFLRETPSSGAVAKGVLESAQRELESLSKRLEAVKREEALRVEKSLAAQAQRYEAQISKQAQEAVNKLSSKEEDWQKSFEEERARQMEEFKTKLNKELATQSEIINDRLKEEVIAQGIEMQRRWMRDIKAQVEKERGGRLARLDELASDLKELERTTLDNSSALDDNVNVHTLWTAIRSIASVIDDETRKRPFSEQLRVLKNTPKAREDDVIRAALEVIEASGVAETGVESFTTLKQWFDDKVSPRIRSVSLVPSPEQSGLLSYMVSATFSPLLFRKKGLVEGEDVPSVLSRVEHYLDRKDLDNAARELNQLKGWPKTLAKDWLDASRKRLETQQALEVVNTEASLASLLVV